MKTNKFFTIFTVVLIALTGTALFMVKPAAAIDASSLGVDKLGDLLNLGSNDPRLIATQLINVALSFLSLLFLILILKAGFMFLVSGGDQQKMEAAKRSIFNAIIGAILVLSAWGIVKFAIEALINATQ